MESGLKHLVAVKAALVATQNLVVEHNILSTSYNEDFQKGYVEGVNLALGLLIESINLIGGDDASS